MTVTATTLDDVLIDLVSSLAASGSAYSVGTYSVPDGATIVVQCATAYPDLVSDFTVADTGSHTWLSKIGPLGVDVYETVDVWHNNTGSTQSITPTVTPTYTANKTVGIGVFLISGDDGGPIVANTLVNTGGATLP